MNLRLHVPELGHPKPTIHELSLQKLTIWVDLGVHGCPWVGNRSNAFNQCVSSCSAMQHKQRKPGLWGGPVVFLVPRVA